MTPKFIIEALDAKHDRRSFNCGVEPLDTYFQERVTQDIKRRISNCFVICAENGAIAGYYTFAATSLPLNDLTDDLKKRLPRYPLVPAALIGRLAVDSHYRNKGLGGTMIIDAALRASHSDTAIYALIVDAKDNDSKAFYQHLGFQCFFSRPLSLYLPIATALKSME